MTIQEAPISIALVDDSLILRNLMSSYLAKQGFEILFEADNGARLLDSLEQSSRLPDLCLLDSSMPVMNGHETAARLRELYPSIRVMAYSFFDESDTADNMLASGAHAFVSKDAEAFEVRDALLALCGRSVDKVRG